MQEIANKNFALQWSSSLVPPPRNLKRFFHFGPHSMWKNQKKHCFFSWKKTTSLSLILVSQILSQGRVMATFQFGNNIPNRATFSQFLLVRHPLIYFRTSLIQRFLLSSHNVEKRPAFAEISSFFINHHLLV